MRDHDSRYHRLFEHPAMVAELLRDFGAPLFDEGGHTGSRFGTSVWCAAGLGLGSHRDSGHRRAGGVARRARRTSFVGRTAWAGSGGRRGPCRW